MTQLFASSFDDFNERAGAVGLDCLAAFGDYLRLILSNCNKYRVTLTPINTFYLFSPELLFYKLEASKIRSFTFTCIITKQLACFQDDTCSDS